jgi:hypothetical protein
MTAIERQMAADAVALSKEHADRADAAEGRWTDLRDKLTRDAYVEQELGDGYGDVGTGPDLRTAYKHWGKAEALREVLAHMEREEG